MRTTTGPSSRKPKHRIILHKTTELGASPDVRGAPAGSAVLARGQPRRSTVPKEPLQRLVSKKKKPGFAGSARPPYGEGRVHQPLCAGGGRFGRAPFGFDRSILGKCNCCFVRQQCRQIPGPGKAANSFTFRLDPGWVVADADSVQMGAVPAESKHVCGNQCQSQAAGFRHPPTIMRDPSGGGCAPSLRAVSRGRTTLKPRLGVQKTTTHCGLKLNRPFPPAVPMRPTALTLQ